jgi:hypothetical protein
MINNEPAVTADICPPKSRKLSPISVSRTSRVIRCCERSIGFFPRVVSALAEQTIADSVPAVARESQRILRRYGMDCRYPNAQWIAATYPDGSLSNLSYW